MVSYLQTLYIQVGFLGILDSMLIFQRFKRNVKPLNWMVSVVSLALLRAILEIIINPERIGWDPYRTSHFVVYALSIIALYTYGEFLIGEKPLIRRASIVYTLFGSFITLLYSGTLIDLSDKKNPPGWPFKNAIIPYWEFPFDLLSVFIWSFMLIVFLKMAIFSDKKEAKILSIGLVISMGLFLIVALYELSEHFTGDEVSAAITTIPAFLILIGVYSYNPRFAYSSPVELYRIVLLHEHGQTIVEEVFAQKYKDDTNTNILLSGVTTSLNSMFKELTKSSADLEIMKSSTSTLLFAKSKNIIAILEVAKSTHILRNALNEFADKFANKYEKDLDDFKGDLEKFIDYKEIFLRYFPFLK